MMFINFIVVIVVALSATGLVAAKKCRTGGVYCGRYLLQRGDYTNMIITHLRALNVTPEDYNIKNSLWACVDHGEIVFSDLCTVGCVGGDSKEDYCAARGKSEGQEQGGEAVASV